MSISKVKGNPIAMPWIPTNGSVPAVYSDAIFDINLTKEVDGAEVPKTQAEINAEVIERLDGLTSAGLEKEIVDNLPAIADGKENVIYMVKKEDGDNGDYYVEYLFIPANGDKEAYFEPIGSTKIDLSNYYTKSEVDEKLSDITVEAGTGIKTIKLKVGNNEAVSLASDGSNAVIIATSDASGVAEGDRSKTLVNVDALNAAIAAAADDYAKASDLTTLSGKVDTLEGSVDVLTESVNTLESTVGSLSSTVGTVEGKVTTLESTVGSLSSTVGTVEGKVTTLEGSVSDLEDSVGAIQTAVDGLDDKIDDKIDAAIGDEGVVANAIKDALSGYQTELTFTTNPGQNGILVVTSGEDDKEGDVINSSISMSYDSENKKIQIKNSSDALVAEMDATVFIKDGMLSSIALEEGTGDDAGKTYMVFTWNTDSGHDVVKLDVSEFLKQLETVVLGDANGISNGVVTIAAVKTGEALAAAAGGEATKDKLTTAGAVKEYVDSTITAEMSKIPELTENSAGGTYGLLSLNVLDAVLDKHVMTDDDITAALNAVDVI